MAKLVKVCKDKMRGKFVDKTYHAFLCDLVSEGPNDFFQVRITLRERQATVLLQIMIKIVTRARTAILHLDWIMSLGNAKHYSS